jgi:hypothetical protein
VRLNGTSDLPWERIAGPYGLSAFQAFPAIQFYDYSKIATRVLMHASGLMPVNYHLTFSRSESNQIDVAAVVAAGANVAAVFQKSLPAVWHGVPVVNGDADDLRFLDASGVIVGLKAKGRAKRDTSGFVVVAGAPVGPVMLPMVATS